MIGALAGVLVPVFATLAIGAFAGRTGRVDRARIHDLNVLVMEFMIPAALFLATISTSRRILVGHAPYLLAMAGGMVAIYALVLVLAARLLRMGAGEASIVALVVAFPNLAAIGLPLTHGAFGDGMVVLDAIGIATGAIVISPATLVLLERAAGRGAAIGPAIGRALIRPIVAAPLLGIACALAGIHLPGLARAALMPLAGGAGGVALFVTGVILSAQQVRLDARVAILVGIKNVVHPAAAFLIASALGAAPADMRVAFVLSAVPCGFFGVLFGQRYGIASPDASATLLVSTVVSAVTLPVALALAH